MLKMVTKTKHEYAGVNLGPGDEFTAESQEHVDLLTLLGRAELKGDEKPKEQAPENSASAFASGSRTRRARSQAS